MLTVKTNKNMGIRDIVKIIKNGGIGVMPTDTIYGLVGSALSRKAVERIYKLRERDRKKPFIVLISYLRDLKKFGIKISKSHLKILKTLWFPPSGVGGPGPTSIILTCLSKKFSYLHRGTKTIAFRLPKDKQLRNFLKKSGPLVAPSANPAAKPPAKTIKEARMYFGDKIDFYVDGGKIVNEPSVLVEIKR